MHLLWEILEALMGHLEQLVALVHLHPKNKRSKKEYNLETENMKTNSANDSWNHLF